jgi:uncharacterized membrane protein
MATATSHRPQPLMSARVIGATAIGVALIVFVVLVVGGYALHWRWTGLSGSVTLWDWLEVLALPVAIGTAPLLLRHRRGLSRTHRTALAVGAIVFVAFVLAGYLVPWTWTGFRGNTLWDWLQLVLLPLVVTISSSWWHSDWRPRRRHLFVATAGAVTFAVVVVAGYLVPMTWTGFSGNSLWDWVKLLLLPVVIPTVLVPLLARELSERLDR